eukprot:TRINITY_DN3181_c0_g1_i2.p1 TRINITY_DN3181_c0_g1~~TRINITY_DN3181_c0_g1_i2.p1  ORF type:complete len:418 (-),score=66.45 TRINITY_DN3181_c0_g1_i2:357-1547(-)
MADQSSGGLGSEEKRASPLFRQNSIGIGQPGGGLPKASPLLRQASLATPPTAEKVNPFARKNVRSKGGIVAPGTPPALAQALGKRDVELNSNPGDDSGESSSHGGSSIPNSVLATLELIGETHVATGEKEVLNTAALPSSVLATLEALEAVEGSKLTASNSSSAKGGVTYSASSGPTVNSVGNPASGLGGGKIARSSSLSAGLPKASIFRQGSGGFGSGEQKIASARGQSSSKSVNAEVDSDAAVEDLLEEMEAALKSVHGGSKLTSGYSTTPFSSSEQQPSEVEVPAAPVPEWLLNQIKETNSGSAAAAASNPSAEGAMASQSAAARKGSSSLYSQRSLSANAPLPKNLFPPAPLVRTGSLTGGAGVKAGAFQMGEKKIGGKGVAVRTATGPGGS